MVEDVRRDETFMRVTWHGDSRVFVVSHWRGEVCVAATRVSVDAAPDLINLFVRGLAESAGQAAVAPNPESRRESLFDRIRRLVKRNTQRAA